jgi:4-amino-4-deoxy-L-arabinose transferase-like glycosyltransferase
MCPSPAHAGLRTWIALVLSVLMLGALALRLQVVWQRTSNGPDKVALRLAGDEIGYEEFAYALLQGASIPSPVRVPAYPMFIAAAYYALGERSPAKLLDVQALVGVVAVPLTYLLARRLTGIIPALVAAGIVALDDSLIWHARGIFTELLYTPCCLSYCWRCSGHCRRRGGGALRGPGQAWSWSRSAVLRPLCFRCFHPCCYHRGGPESRRPARA